MSSRITPGIYVQAKGVSGASSGAEGVNGYKHLYLIYHKADGSNEVIRGGPSAGIIGELAIQMGKSLEDSEDKNPQGTPRPSKRLDIEAEDLDSTWVSMRRVAEAIAKGHLKYDSLLPGDGVPEQNSNSVIRRILESQGVDARAALPDGVSERDVPGYENNLDEPEYNDPYGMGDPAASNDEHEKSLDGAEISDTPANSPEVSQLKTDLMPSDKESARAELLYKTADQLTDAEVKDLGHWYHDLQPSDPLRGTLDRKRRDFYALTYGDELATTDATGRMVRPEPKRRVPETPTPANAAGGGTLMDGIERIAGTLVKTAAELGAGETVKGLQTGLNLGGASLKVDGIAGPITRGALMTSLAEKGAGKTEKATALGVFRRFAESERASGGSASGLKKTIERSVQPLFGASKPKAAAEALQTVLNGLGKETASAKNSSEPEPLKIDGDIGPKTADAFRSALLEHGPERIAKRYGEELGFGL